MFRTDLKDYVCVRRYWVEIVLWPIRMIFVLVIVLAAANIMYYLTTLLALL